LVFTGERATARKVGDLDGKNHKSAAGTDSRGPIEQTLKFAANAVFFVVPYTNNVRISDSDVHIFTINSPHLKAGAVF
jgi:hypothetical protein